MLLLLSVSSHSDLVRLLCWLMLLPRAGRQMIYELEEMFPGPGLNLLLGPNGSGTTKHAWNAQGVPSVWPRSLR